MIFYNNGRVYEKSTAAIEILKSLGGIWKIAKAFYIIPKILRDGLYDQLSKNRYKWFGKQDTCWLPTPELKKRFL
jgi:predicted DCC family thiol-disulfide oxidoreductase YuxK